VEDPGDWKFWWRWKMLSIVEEAVMVEDVGDGARCWRSGWWKMLALDAGD
jgi:hypothetical protein